jgi:hypothetical protein
VVPLAERNALSHNSRIDAIGDVPIPSCGNAHMAGFDWNDLKSFLAIARSGRLTTAAARLGVDHSTLSRRLGALEHALKARLFDRSPSGYMLTEPAAAARRGGDGAALDRRRRGGRRNRGVGGGRGADRLA